MIELQDYQASKVAAACILAARKMLKISEVWPLELENLTKFHKQDLIKISETILQNYNLIKMNAATLKTSDILGPSPIKYEFMKIGKDTAKSELNIETSSISQVSCQNSVAFTQCSPKTRPKKLARAVSSSVNSLTNENSYRKAKVSSRVNNSI